MTLLSPIRTGATAVLFFFALSGFVLTVNSSKNSYLDWTGRRLIRLYPVYIVAWLFGLILVAANDRHVLNLKVLALGFFGFQILSPEATLVVNAPLWSLSVEIVCAMFLFYLIKLRSHPTYLFALLIIIMFTWIQNKHVPILGTLPFFISGIILRNDKILKFRINNKLVKFVLVFSGFYYVFIGAPEIAKTTGTFSSYLFRIIGISIFLFLFSRATLNSFLKKMAIALGKRSFCLYAFHYPILLFFNYFIDPSNGRQFFAYCTLSIAFTAFTTEIGFRLIDRPSMAMAKRGNG